MDKPKELFLYTLYGVHFDGRRAYLKVSYNHSTRPEFSTAIVKADGKIEVHAGHPKRAGVTRSENWSVDVEALHGGW